jgi:hypothetical protein
MPLISVKGNKFVDPDGKTVLFRGLSISDPDKLEMQGHWSKDHFAKVKEMGAKLVRIPVHPVAWRERTPPAYLKLLDQAVGWYTELDMYIILDWNSIGNLATELFQDPMYDTTKQETYSFWRVMARHFAGHNTVAFFELFPPVIPPAGQTAAPVTVQPSSSTLRIRELAGPSGASIRSGGQRSLETGTTSLVLQANSPRRPCTGSSSKTRPTPHSTSADLAR